MGTKLPPFTAARRTADVRRIRLIVDAQSARDKAMEGLKKQ
jgi:hypothetical protein